MSSPERIAQVLRYADGRLFWEQPSKNHAGLTGKEAGSVYYANSGKAYWVVQVDGRKYRRSRIVFCLFMGRWPVEQIDHIDGDSLNDVPGNLREATATQNAWNHKRRAKRSALPMGVRASRYGTFEARIAANKKTYFIGTFATPEAAHREYLAARRVHFGEFA
jgi:hypothetical protein